MDPADMVLIEGHLEENAQLKSLWDEHLDFERQLEKIDRKPFLNPEEKVEKKRLQIAKLTGKTRIEGILTKYRALET